MRISLHTKIEEKEVLNRLLNRLMELDALHLEIYKISGYTVEQLKDMFLAGYTLSPPIQHLVWRINEEDSED